MTELMRGINIFRIRMNTESDRIIKKEVYEPFICNIMNESSYFFKNKPIIMNNNKHGQSNGEPDFLDAKNNKYEVKLMINTKQGNMLGRDDKKDIQGFINEIVTELQEFGNHINNNDIIDIEDTIFYKIVEKRVESIEDDENIVLFIPFPIFPDRKDLIFLSDFTDFAQKVYDELVKNELIGEREFYYVYPAQDGNSIVVRNPKIRKKEFLNSPDFKKYFVYESVN